MKGNMDVLPPMEEIRKSKSEVEPEIYGKSFLENSSFVDESIDVPPLENIPDLSELPSFLGKTLVVANVVGSQGQDHPVLVLSISLAAINTHLLS